MCIRDSTNTELLQDAFRKRAELEGKTIEEVYAAAGKKVPMGRVGEPEDIAAVSYTHLDVYKRQGQRSAEPR